MATEPRFEIGPRLGAGGMGVVYEALDREQGKRVALKRLARVGPLEIHQLKREFRSLADVVHPNLVRLHELLTADDGEPFFTMELVLGVDFLAYVQRGLGGEEATVSLSQALRVDPEAPARSEARAGGAVDVTRLRHALGQLALGLSALHRAGKVHRDLKPSNVMVHDDGRLVILDFGLVRSRRREDTESEPLIGTAAYMAPEQVTGARPSPASDWYSFGVMLYEALTGRCPHDGALGELLRRKLAEDPAHPLALAPDAPPDLADLAARLLARRPEARPTEAEVLAALGVDAPAPRLGDSLDAFVGREAECRALADAVDDVRAGRSVTVHVAGQSGMGKTALVERVLDDLRGAGDVLVLRGRCFERETVPYKTVDGLVDALAQHLTSLDRDERAALLPPDAASLARVFPALLRVPAIADSAIDAPVVQDDQELRRRGFLALKRLLAALGRRHTLVLAVDDLQWGDLDGARVLIELQRPPDAPRLLLVGSYRSEEAARSPCVTALLTEAREHSVWRDTRHVSLGALTQVEAFELALTALSTAGRPLAELDDLAASIAGESDGSPFYVWELAHAALRGGREDVTLTRLLEERIRGLEEGAQRLLEVVAIAGGPVAQHLVAHAAESAEPRDALAMLRSQRLVRARGLSDADTVETYHDRVRETVLAALDPSRRRELHRRVATALEGRGGADPEQLAEHWGHAGESDRAAELAVIAGDRAAHALAFERAARVVRVEGPPTSTSRKVPSASSYHEAQVPSRSSSAA
ncbi:MAG TPA: protein kinase, partial [Polyangiaceae bacterium]|nr:protein kinase [Polyangiaceae bacterium]